MSIVALPCLRFVQVALCNGHAPQSTTGVAMPIATHSQFSNWRGGIIDISSTGAASAAERISRRRRGAVVSGSSRSAGACFSATGSAAL